MEYNLHQLLAEKLKENEFFFKKYLLFLIEKQKLKLDKNIDFIIKDFINSQFVNRTLLQSPTLLYTFFFQFVTKFLSISSNSNYLLESRFLSIEPRGSNTNYYYRGFISNDEQELKNHWLIGVSIVDSSYEHKNPYLAQTSFLLIFFKLSYEDISLIVEIPKNVIREIDDSIKKVYEQKMFSVYGFRSSIQAFKEGYEKGTTELVENEESAFTKSLIKEIDSQLMGLKTINGKIRKMEKFLVSKS